ncbi:PTS system transporter subunit IIC [Lacticaseibacillus pantheris DSM 15945 = JCM 12539 = NBRC 106106]|uniref:Permease IIC component n=1 Tax=Lacticaseibacillus pantheris DSM 15945 = JCM 12539 = NBRC 106106 TaxID=1423783 RepID=A0A0R1TXA9_9LACO|nr:PTS transporter subunit EIIC [Lacticaseibacillus pantheris]KRL85830.1 PTS system transporter subunit IIC [Lacticaseibacillus pantheris DSM 15945 = JCM 12539 = NBRC 106106]
MNKLVNWLSVKAAPAMKKFISRPWIAAIADSMQKIIPFILAGSMIFLYNVIRSYVPVLPDLTNISNFTFGMLGIIVSYLIASEAMENLKHPQYLQMAGLTSVAVFIININPKINAKGLMTVEFGRFGATGLLIGMLTGIAVALVFHLWSKLHILEDSSIPDFVVGWINTIIPILISVAIFTTIVFIGNVDLFNLVAWLFSPLQSFGQTLPGFILISLIPSLLYTMGISSWAFNAVSTPIFMAGISANIAAVAAGGAATNISTSEVMFTSALITMGGMGATLTLNILMLFAKSRRLKAIGRICIAPSIFNINEPLMFSGPVVMNPILMIPMWINSITGPLIVWTVMRLGLLNIPAKMIQVGQIPAPFSSIMITEDWRAVIWYVVLFALYMATWYPFLKVYDHELLVKEAEE